ncbi:hypothetical protein FRB90_007955 [Tulasnella sp. 427]|nr:hypothetical protein FRB90_007955 [Tulasnella sp. 427]
MFRLPTLRSASLQRRPGIRLLSHGGILRQERSEISAISDILAESIAPLKSANDDKARAKAFTTVQAAYGKLETLVIPPTVLLQQVSMSYQLPMVLGTVNDLGIAEVLSRGIFEEVAPDVWAHNKASRLLDSGLPYEEIVKDPIHRLANGRPGPAWVSHVVEQGGMAAVSMVMAFRDEKYKKSEEVAETPFTKIYGIDVSWREWLEREGRVLNITKPFELNNIRNPACDDD